MKKIRQPFVQHKLIPPRTPWHNGKVKWSHRNDQRYFYNWEKFAGVKDRRKLKDHFALSNRKPVRTLGGKSPLGLLREILSNAGSFLSLFSLLTVGHIYLQRRVDECRKC